MNEPKWLLQSIIVAIHDTQITEHGGLSGIRDEGLLNSSLARPKIFINMNKLIYMNCPRHMHLLWFVIIISLMEINELIFGIVCFFEHQ